MKDRKKIIKKRIICLFIFILCSFSYGCGNKNKASTDNNKLENNTIENNTNAAETNSSAEEIGLLEQCMKNANVKLYDADEFANDNKDIKPFLDYSEYENEKSPYLVWINIIFIDSENAVIEYSCSMNKEDGGNAAGAEGDYEDEYYEEQGYDFENIEHHLALVDIKTKKIIKDISVEGGYNSSVYANSSGIYTMHMTDEKTEFFGYDKELNLKYEFEYNDFSNAYINEENTKAYYILDEKLYCYDIVNAVEKEVPLKDEYKISYIDAIISSEKEDHIIIYAEAYNAQSYRVVLNAESGETEKILNDDSFIQGTSGASIIFNTTEVNLNKYIVACADGTCTEYQYEDETYNNRIQTFGNGKVVIIFFKEDKIVFELYEKDKLYASTSINYTSEEKKNTEDIYISNQPVITADGNIVFAISDNKENKSTFYEWVPEKAFNDEKIAEVNVFDKDKVKNINLNEELDMSEYESAELNEALKALRKKADEIEKEYNLKILIGEECRGIITGFAVSGLTDYDSVSEALTVLSKELQRYPDNFFSQFKDDYNDGIEIYLAGSITGMDDTSLSTVGGFCCEYEGYQLVVLDATFAENIKTTFHHELWHAIDNKIFNNNLTDDTYCLDISVWNKFNPEDSKHESIYTNDFSMFGYPENQKYAFTNEYKDGEDIYFVDDYSMVDELEDRARIFEEAISETYGVDFEKCPKLKAKLDYMSKCIRDNFDTSGWEEVPWEHK